MRRYQSGITFIGGLVLLVVVGGWVYIGIRLVPVYLNYMKIARTMDQVAKEFKSDNPDPARIRVALDRHWAIEDVYGVESKEIEIKKDGDSVVMHVGYDQSVPYIANVSLMASFDKTVKVE